jgi:hypothetical protein
MFAWFENCARLVDLLWSFLQTCPSCIPLCMSCACCGGDMFIICLQNGYTALMWAADKGQASCVRLLLDAGANKDLKDNVRDVYRFASLFHLSFLSGIVFLYFLFRLSSHTKNHMYIHVSMLCFACSGRPDCV